MGKPRYECEIVERLACDIANLWLRQRRDPRITDAIDPVLLRKLDELEGLMRGDDRRCFCLSKDSGRHDVQCPAYVP